MLLEPRLADLRLTPDPSRVVIRPFHIAAEPRDLNPTQTPRARRIVETVLHMPLDACARELAVLDTDFADRHWQVASVYETRCAQIMEELGLVAPVETAQRELIGAYFCHEYSYAAAAITNPSLVPHPDQSGLAQGDQRIVMSLRAVGEGHISSIAFREAILTAKGELTLWPEPAFSMAAQARDPTQQGEVVADRPEAAPISGTVIFPFTRAQRNGLEDLRLVRFVEDDGRAVYYGTYTAYSGGGIGSELLETDAFSSFRLSPMSGDAAHNKGIAIFPRRIGGAYAAIGRQDGENLYFMRSDDPRCWNGGVRVLGPKFHWELVQIGNCGAPIELDEGWLLITHGVGAMRKYAIGAALLDKDDPSKVLGRLSEPLLASSHANREGYVPNVVYTCGAMRHRDELFMPFGVADSSVSFAWIDLRSLLQALS